MIAWLTDTLLYTGVLIALVLVLRRPVARHFGAQMGYALWALPLLRFIMPPVVLPASFAPDSTTVISQTTTTVTTTTDGAPMMATEVYYVAEPTFWESWGSFIVSTALLVWLAGAVAFLAWRAWTYFQMREWLLRDSRPVGESGRIRLVETPAVSSPVAFGVSDKVVALPIGFMASENRAARDLAIEHELAHHRGRDLLANILAQPILALHWFNPLAWMGWRAMRRDQEAACDARVVACCDPRDRAVYGHVIASFASGQRLALAAPMACPVLGEKSIIHRLKSLSRTDVSPRRRLAGRVLLAGAALALPFTASISYSEAIASPRAPAMPKAPQAPRAPGAITIVDVPGGAELDDAKLHTKVIHKDGQTIILKTAQPVSDAEAQERVERAQASMAQAMAFAPDPAASRDLDIQKLREQAAADHWDEFGAEWSKQAEAMEKAGNDWEKWGETYGKQWEAFGEKMGKMAIAAPTPVAPPAPPAFIAPTISVKVVPSGYQYTYTCDKDGNPIRIPGRQGKVGTAEQAKCKTIATANARAALTQARARIARDRSLDEDVRDGILDSLDDQIDRLNDSAEG